MKCPKCGRENTNNRKTCKFCGTELHPYHDSILNRLYLLTAVLFVVFAVLAASEVISGDDSGGGVTSGVADTGKTDVEEVADAGGADTGKTDVEEVADTGKTKNEEVVDAGESSTEGLSSEGLSIADISHLPDEFILYNGHTYAFYDANNYEFESYQQVADFCREMKGHLAVINDRAENNFLFGKLREKQIATAYFGYSDENEEGNWEWSDVGSTFENWTKVGGWSLPDNGIGPDSDEDYAEFNYEKDKPGIPSDGTWNDAAFQFNTTTFICEWDCTIDQ